MENSTTHIYKEGNVLEESSFSFGEFLLLVTAKIASSGIASGLVRMFVEVLMKRSELSMSK